MESNVLRQIKDIISDLPDPILGNILSFLPTKNAAATSILSTRWKNIFPSDLPRVNIDLDESHLLHPRGNDAEFDSTSFIHFVDKLLNETLHNVLHVETFTIICEKTFGDAFEAKFKSWMCALVRLGVLELRVRCCLYNTDSLFDGITGSTTITKLELKGEWKDATYDGMLAFYIEPDFNLPTLKRVELFSIAFHDDSYEHEGDESTLMMFINACPALEELSLTECDLQGIWDLRITSLVLKILKIEKSLVNEPGITINAPNLELLLLLNNCEPGETVDVPISELLLLNNHAGHKYCVYPFKSLGLGHNDVKPWYYESVRDLVYDCRKIRQLYLALSSVEHLPCANKQLSGFQYLTRLSLSSVRSKGWIVLACILNNAPNLEQLTFEEEFEQGDMGFEDFQQLVPSPPTCLELHIRHVEFKHFGEKKDEIKLLNYFFQNGKVLEKVVRNTDILSIKR